MDLVKTAVNAGGATGAAKVFSWIIAIMQENRE
jgi:hypothetical protein